MVHNLIILSTVWCEPNSSAAGIHMKQIVEFLSAKEFKITYASTANLSENKLDLSIYQVEEVQIKLNDSSFDEWILSQKPDFVLFDRYMSEEQFGWRVREIYPEAVTLLNTEDLHSLRKSRQSALVENLTWTEEYWKAHEITKREIASLYRVDASVFVSNTEIALLKGIGFKEDQLIYLPIRIESATDTLPMFEEKKHFYSIGNYMHEPNLDSLKYIKESIWPLIKKAIPDAEFHSYGSYPNGKAQALNAPKIGFHIKGKLEDVNTLAKYKICLAPLRFGAGIKGKFLEAMRLGTPSVTTSIGIEDLSTKEKWAGSVAETPEQLAMEAILLYQDEKVWNIKQKIGFQILEANFKSTEHLENFYAKLIEIKSKIETYRHSNLIGEILKLNANNSSKYFSKWIEEKNKK
jgi:O-antigen biosynthesis protein